MNLKIDKYSKKYEDQVVDCLQRNYSWMTALNKHKVIEWCHPIFTYRWYDDISEQEFLYKYGAVMLLKQRVVGFFGKFISRRYEDYNRKPYIQHNGTTWCIDKEFRFGLYDLMKLFYTGQGMFYEVTAIQSMEELYTSVYGFTYANKEKYRFFPVPFQGESSLSIEVIDDSGQMDDDILQLDYRDHIPFGVKCIKVCAGVEKGYVFYRLVHANGTWVRILKIVNQDLISNNVHEVFWKIQQTEQFNDCITNEIAQSKISSKAEKGEWVRLECDKSFLNEVLIRHPQYDIRPAPRLILNKCEGIKPCNDLLYTELAIMDFG